MIKLTTDHTSSSNGIHVFLDNDNNAVGYSDGFKLLRKENDWTVQDLAGMLGVTPHTVEGWEQGIRKPQKTTLLLLAARLNR